MLRIILSYRYLHQGQRNTLKFAVPWILRKLRQWLHSIFNWLCMEKLQAKFLISIFSPLLWRCLERFVHRHCWLQWIICFNKTYSRTVHRFHEGNASHEALQGSLEQEWNRSAQWLSKWTEHFKRWEESQTFPNKEKDDWEIKWDFSLFRIGTIWMFHWIPIISSSIAQSRY